MRKISFLIKLVVLFTAVVIAQGIITGVYSFNHTRQIVEGVKKKELSDVVNGMDININTTVRNIMALLDGAASVSTEDAAEDEGLSDDGRSIYLDSVQRANSMITALYIVGNGQVSWQSGASALEGSTIARIDALSARSMRTKFWFKEAQPGGHIIAVSQLNRRGRHLVARISPYTFAQRIIGYSSHFSHQLTYILGDEHAVIATNNNYFSGDELAQIEAVFERGEPQFDLTIGGKAYHVAGQYNALTGWRTYTLIWHEDIFPQAQALRHAILLFVAGLSILGFVLVWILAYAMLQPIRTLMLSMQRIESGDFTVRVPNRRRDEIGRLTEAFNDMASRIHHLINEVYAKKLEQKNAELRALQSQINPHFLYNTLDTINWMLIDRSEFEISDIVVALGELMKYAMRTEVLVTLNEELQYLEQYLTIQRNRLEDRLSYAISGTSELEGFTVPKLIVQPLVENAIKHAVEPKPEGGEIEVKARRTGNWVIITVKDDGPGMSAEQMSMNGSFGGSHEHIGLSNVRKRLELYYGAAAMLDIDSSAAGTTVRIRIPWESGEEVDNESHHRG